MKTIAYHTLDKSKWGAGPWLTEPDKIQWQDPETKLPCLMVRQQMGGHWCGYVGVPSDHPLYGVGYDAPDVHIHGGLTYARSCDPDEPQAVSVCHRPDPGEPDDIWWFGFDCAHSSDISPGFPQIDDMMADLAKVFPGSPMPHREYRTESWVKAEVTELASQLKPEPKP